VRPVSAWSDEQDPLNQKIENIAWSDISAEEALVRIADIIYGHGDPSSPQMERHGRGISIRIDAGTVIDLLNAVVRTDGEMTWAVTYPASQGARAVRFRLSLTAFKGHTFTIGRPILPPSLMGNPSRPN
jgi:hypothetical protein